MFQFKLPVVSKRKGQIFYSCLEKLNCTVDSMSFALGLEKDLIFDKEVSYYEVI
jgi:hypothetical protein